MKMLGWIMAFWVASVPFALAQEAEQGIIVTGQGVVSLPPDMATVGLGVRQTAETAAEAVNAVNAAVAQILERLDGLGIAPADRQTAGFWLRPVTTEERGAADGGPLRIVGYEAGNSVRLRLRDLAGLGGVMDGVLETGANSFDGLSFGLQDPAAPLAEARALAVADAMRRAEQLAAAAGLTLGGVLRITENSYQGPVVMMEAAQSRAGMGAAVAEGEVDVRAEVVMVFAIAPGR